MDEEDNKNEPQDRGDRAKAFFRAMYAGGEPDPDQFGMDVGQKEEKNSAANTAALAHLEGQLKEAEQKATEAENLYKRMAADFENYRKRVDREREEFQALGMQKAFETILPALDDLEMATSKLTEKTESKVMFDSLKMVFSRLNRCLEMVGIKQMTVVGEVFDPRLHEPVQEVPTREVPDGCVAQQLRAGWMFKEKILRPALVNVATTPGDEEEAPAPEATAEAAAEAVAEAEAVIESPEEAKSEEAKSEEAKPEEAKPEEANEDLKKSAKKVTAKEVVNQAGVETCDTLDALDTGNRSTQDLPIEEIKAAIKEAEEEEELALASAAVAAEAKKSENSSGEDDGEEKEGKVYDISDADGE